jgi:hypothetical protein
MNPYSQLGVDQQTAGYLGQAGINPASSFQADSQAASKVNAAYPTYPNAAGVGSQTAGQQSQNNASSTSGPGVVTPNKSDAPDVSVRGMSPYSLVGDANYRDD